MVNYRDGKIYRLVSGSGKQYIGSTTQKLCRRIAEHRGKYKRWKDGKINFVTSFSLFEEENGNVEIVLIEKFACESKEELHSRERYWIETMDCVNKYIPSRTKKEYREQNREQILEYQKQYREQNREQILEYKKQYREQNIEQISEHQKQYYEQNREQKLEYQKQYREQNREQISEYQKRKIQCECGAEITYNGLSTHKKTKKHKEAMKHCSSP